MNKGETHFDLIAIGSGSAGGVGAALAASLGKKVALVEKDKVVGGECPNWGCVPTKALLHAADVYRTLQTAGDYGIEVGKLGYNYPRIKKWKDLVVSRTGASEGDTVFTQDGIKILHGTAKFLSPHELQVGNKTYSAKHFLIGTGSTDFIPPIPGLTEAGYITFLEAIDLQKLPKSIFIIGGGPIGTEFAQLFMSFGVKVHIADSLPRLLAHEEPEVGNLIEALYNARGTEVICEASVYKIEKTKGKKVVYWSKHGHNHTTTVDEIMVATGKRANTSLGLEAAEVHYNRRGISTNHQMQTSQKHIYAAGDVVGPYLFTHTSSYQSHIAAHNMFHTRKLKADYSAVPRCIFTSPEAASVGITSAEAAERGLKIKVGAVPIAVLGRANTSDSGDGFVKVIADQRGRLLGAAMVAPHAGEMIHELALAIKLNAKASDLAGTIHAFPTYSEAIKMACALIK